MGEGAMFLSAQSAFSTPNSMSGETYTATLTVPVNLKQGLVTSSPELKRLQQDLLILTSFNDNSTLHWRPLWFDQADQFTECFWTLHNPPNVVTELLPFRALGRPVTTRRMRRRDDPPALYIKSWEHWYRYCELYGIPVDFLCEEQVALMRLGLPEFSNGKLCGTFLAPSSPSCSACSLLIPPRQNYRHTRSILSRSPWVKAGTILTARCIATFPASSKG